MAKQTAPVKPAAEAPPAQPPPETGVWVRLEDTDTLRQVPEARQRLLTIDGVTYAHCGEDAQGHWIYRKD